MKKILLLLLLVTGYSNAQIVTIPDVNFKNVLLSNSSINSNNNSEIELSEALTVTNLNVSSSSIVDLTGISSFSNLQILDCSQNNLTFLNFSSLTNLTTLICSNNQIANSFDFTSNPNLTYLDCNNNVISGINFSSLANLQWMDCSYNSIQNDVNFSGNLNLMHWNSTYNTIASINLSGCTSLSFFEHYDEGFSPVFLNNLNLSGCTSLTGMLRSNVVESLNVSGCSNLTLLFLAFISDLNISGCTSLQQFAIEGLYDTSIDFSGFTNLTLVEILGASTSSINFSGCTNLSHLELGTVDINSLDVSFTPNLSYFKLSNNLQLKHLFVKNGHNDALTLMNCPNLEYICVDDSEIDYYTNLISQLGYTTQINSYCSFVPGGSYNAITGNLIFDTDNDGCDANDIHLQDVRLTMNNGSLQETTFVNILGDYNFYPQIGNFSITPQIENATWFTFTPSSAVISFSTLGNTTTQNFCLAPVGVHADVEVVIIPIEIARPGFDASYRILFKNKGNQPLSGNLVFNFPDAVLDYVSATQIPNAQNAGSLTWNYTNLMPFERRDFQVTLNVNSPQETPAVNIGDILNFSSIVSAVAGDELPLDNTFAFDQTVIGSFDPNDKVCLEGTSAPTSKIGDYLHYTINFENTGTAPATFVVVKDIIDTTKFDLSSLQIMNSSHAMETRITGNKVEYIFNNINLEPNEHGNVTFKIKTKTTLVEGNTVTNKANIYFDYNFPIETNTASTTFQTLSSGEFEFDSSVVIAPNPVKSNVNVNINVNDNKIKTIELFDVQGRLLTMQIINHSQAQLDVSNHTNGVYFVKVTTEKGSKVEKIIKE